MLGATNGRFIIEAKVIKACKFCSSPTVVNGVQLEYCPRCQNKVETENLGVIYDSRSSIWSKIKQFINKKRF